MPFLFFYGIPENRLDITKVVLEKCRVKEHLIYITSGDVPRANLFTDPLPGFHKCIFLRNTDTGKETIYNEYQNLYVNLKTDEIQSEELHAFPNQRLSQIHSQLKIDYGSLDEEFPEQLMVSRYLKGNEKVLEIGGNIGRNSLVIASILNAKGNGEFVVLESDPQSASKLIHNRDINKLQFFVEPRALSKRPLIQCGWGSSVSEEMITGHFRVDTLTLEELHLKYKFPFDTLVLDCEGAFYYILKDMPTILLGVKLIIMENDYRDISHKEFVDATLKEWGFVVDFQEGIGYMDWCCRDCFYQTWIKV